MASVKLIMIAKSLGLCTKVSNYFIKKGAFNVKKDALQQNCHTMQHILYALMRQCISFATENQTGIMKESNID